jgi:hypothetical protein
MTLRSALVTGVLLLVAAVPGSPSIKSGVDLEYPLD